MPRRPNPFTIILLLGLVFGVGAPLFFRLSLWGVERLEEEVVEKPRRSRKVRCPDDYRLATRDGRNVYVDERGRECEF